MNPTPTPTPQAAPMDTYNSYLQKYMQQMGVSAQPTPTPAASGAPAPSGGGMAGGGIAAPLIGYKLGSAMFGGAPVGATASPGMIAPTFAAPATELGALPMMAPTGQVAAAPTAAATTTGTAGTAGAASQASGYAAMTGGPGSLAYWAGPLAGLAAFSAAAPIVSPKIRDFVSNNFFGGKDPRDFIPQEVASSKIVNNQLPGFSDLSNEKRLEIAAKLNELGILGLPGAKSKYTPGEIQYDPFIRTHDPMKKFDAPDLDGVSQWAKNSRLRNTPLRDLYTAADWNRNSKLQALESILADAQTAQINRPITSDSLSPAMLAQIKETFKL